MTLVTNVFRRGGSYYFRVRVPGRFRALLARNELSRSLRTGDPPTARLRASLMSVLTNQLWRDLERAMSNKPVAPTSTQVQSLIEQWLRAELNEDAYLRSAPDGEWHDGVILEKRPEGEDDAPIEFLDESGLRAFRALTPEGQKERLGPKGYLLTGITDLDLRKAAFRKPLKDAELRHRNEDGSLAERHVADVFRRAGLKVSPFTETFEAATRKMMRAHRDVLRAVKQRDNAAWRPELDDDPVSPLISSLSPPIGMTASPKAEPKAPVRGTTLTDAVRSMLTEARQTGLFTEGRASCRAPGWTR